MQAESGALKARTIAELATERTCNRCETTKPRDEMIVQHRSDKGGYFYIRPICKECYNARERGHRRDYKRKYLASWRKRNKALSDSYWKEDPNGKEKARVNAYRHFRENHEAILIQGRMNRRGEGITLHEARELLTKYGRCYPSRHGLTEKGLRECERIRSRMRVRRSKGGSFGFRMLTTFEIRVMVYEMSDEEPGLVIPPELQPTPYQAASERLKQYHRNQRILEGENEDRNRRRDREDDAAGLQTGHRARAARAA